MLSTRENKTIETTNGLSIIGKDIFYWWKYKRQTNEYEGKQIKQESHFDDNFTE